MKFLLFALMLLTGSVCAQDLKGTDRHLYEAIAAELRCPASINLTVFESQAPIAYELKARIAELVLSGHDKESVISELEQRYGSQIRYRPAVNASTAMLWFGPLILLLCVVAALLFTAYRRRRSE